MIDMSHYSKWFPYNNSYNDNALMNVLCFPFAGGTASSYKSWIDPAGPNVNLLPVQLPGREGRMREKPFVKWEEMIRVLESNLMPVFKDKPLVLYGHSMGSKIAFELTHALSKSGVQVLRLVVSGGTAPDLQSRAPAIYQLEDNAFIEEFRRLNGTPEEVLNNKDLMNLLIPFIRADYTINDTYEFADRVPLDCPITAMGGTDDPDVNESELRAWQRHTSVAFKETMFSGDHFFIFNHEEEVVSEILSDINYLSSQLFVIDNYMDF